MVYAAIVESPKIGEPPTVVCVWTMGEDIRRETFPIAWLEKAEPPEASGG